jgi:hypothetical protein
MISLSLGEASPRMSKSWLLVMLASADTTETCRQLVRDALGKKVMLISVDGEVLAHAGALGALDDPTGDALAQLIAEVVDGIRGGRVPAPRDLVASLTGGLPGGLSACATAVGDKAALVVVFDTTVTTLDRVRTKIRRARELLGKSLPEGATAEKPSSH